MRRRQSPAAARACAAVLFLAFAMTAVPTHVHAQQKPWDSDPNVQAVLAIRAEGLEAMTKGTVNAENQRLSSTFVVSTPEGVIFTGTQILERFAKGSLRYDRVDQRIDYAGSHGPDMVVLMGEETVVTGGAKGTAVRRRFTDVFRRENGQWRHDLRHAHVVGRD